MMIMTIECYEARMSKAVNGDRVSIKTDLD